MHVAEQAEAPMAVKGEGTLVLMIVIPWQGCSFTFIFSQILPPEAS